MSEYTYKYVAEIPARINSNRVKKKNVRLLNGKPMIQYAIDACKNSTNISGVYVNTDSDLIGQVAKNNGVNYYRRLPELASDTCKQDEFNYDFLLSTDCEFLVMVNPVSPLVESSDIDAAIEYFEENEFDTLISTRKEQLHAFFRGEALNFTTDALLPATQDIDPVYICTWNICIWRKSTFVSAYEEKGYAAFSGKVGYWAIDPLKALKISYEEDFRMAEEILKAKEKSLSCYKPEYVEYNETSNT